MKNFSRTEFLQTQVCTVETLERWQFSVILPSELLALGSGGEFLIWSDLLQIPGFSQQILSRLVGFSPSPLPHSHTDSDLRYQPTICISNFTTQTDRSLDGFYNF